MALRTCARDTRHDPRTLLSAVSGGDSQLKENLSAGNDGAARVLAEDHRELDEMLAMLFATLATSDAAAVLAQLDLFWARLAMHIRAENHYLFPVVIRELEGHASQNQEEAQRLSESREAIIKLREDHEFFMHQLAAVVNSVRELSKPADFANIPQTMRGVRELLSVVSSRLKSHNQIEEDLVYLLPAELLDQAQAVALEQGVRLELANLPPRFNGRRALLDH